MFDTITMISTSIEKLTKYDKYDEIIMLIC